jgi:hypothetical protein
MKPLEREAPPPFRGFRPILGFRIVDAGSLAKAFSTFATGLPGAGLPIMRLVAGTVSIFRAVAGLSGALAIGRGRVGPQIGASSTDYFLLLMTDRSVNGLMRDKFELGGQVSVAAGPVDRNLGPQPIP